MYIFLLHLSVTRHSVIGQFKRHSLHYGLLIKHFAFDVHQSFAIPRDLKWFTTTGVCNGVGIHKTNIFSNLIFSGHTISYSF